MNPISEQNTALMASVATEVHPDYLYWVSQWQMVRDADVGAVEIKRKGQVYLPKLAGHDQSQYNAYLRRAVYFNMVSRTLNSLYGTVFRRNPKVSGITKIGPMRDVLTRFTKDGMSLHLAAKTAVKEVIAVGRYGFLVDAPPQGGTPFVATYTAENILDWEMSEIDGQMQLSRIVLREVNYKKEDPFLPHRYYARYRVLLLVELDNRWVYIQHVYDREDRTHLPDLSDTPDEIIVPTVRGEFLSSIPFQIIGPFTNTPDVQKPPLMDIVHLNLSHYETYAQLEQGRFYTATPVYYTQTGTTGNDGDVDYYVGPDVVWELGKDGKAGIIEFSGSGLTSLENALHDKEAQIASIGGRLMPGVARGAAESDNSLRMKEQNEQTLLLNIADTTDEGITNVLRILADWRSVPKTEIEKIGFEVNRDFLLKDIGAREFRAIHQMYSDGLIPLSVLFNFLLKAEIIPEWMDEEEYGKLVNDPKQFPHNVDVLAKMKDFPDAKSFHEYRVLKEMMDAESEEAAPRPGEAAAPTPQRRQPIPKSSVKATVPS